TERIAMAGASVITGSPRGPARGRVNPGARFGPAAVAVARRTVRKFVRTPQLIGLAVGTALGFAVGFRLHGPVAAGLAALGLCVLFSFGLSLIWAAAITAVFGALAAVRFSRR